MADPISVSISGFAESARTCAMDGPKTCSKPCHPDAAVVPQ
jgi:hypothetical protein